MIKNKIDLNYKNYPQNEKELDTDEIKYVRNEYKLKERLNELQNMLSNFNHKINLSIINKVIS